MTSLANLASVLVDIADQKIPAGKALMFLDDHGKDIATAITALQQEVEGLREALARETEECARVVDRHKPDASFDDSMSGAVERAALLTNIAAEIRARTALRETGPASKESGT